MRLVIALITLFLFSCEAKKESTSAETKSDTQQENDNQAETNGEYEYYAGPTDGGYLYYKMTLTQKGNEISGSLFSGVYLNNTDQGFYTMPAATVTASFTGKAENGNDVILYAGNVTDTTRIDNTYRLPDPFEFFQQDANGDPVKNMRKVGNDFQCIAERIPCYLKKLQLSLSKSRNSS